ncbi:hypothetical protein FACS189413_12610 [Bacteroidia bacterium]|nr:hypothetical protein FACS189413_12610 [Bacteroidia bacterium]
MDNQPRLEAGYNHEFSHGFMLWIDITLQQIYVGKFFVQMADILHREADVKDIDAEIAYLETFVNSKMWDEISAFYYDVGYKSDGGYWCGGVWVPTTGQELLLSVFSLNIYSESVRNLLKICWFGI